MYSFDYCTGTLNARKRKVAKGPRKNSRPQEFHNRLQIPIYEGDYENEGEDEEMEEQQDEQQFRQMRAARNDSQNDRGRGSRRRRGGYGGW